MQRAAAKTAVRQMGIKRGKPERQSFTPTLLAAVCRCLPGGPQQAPQFPHDGGAASRWGKRLGKSNGFSHLTIF